MEFRLELITGDYWIQAKEKWLKCRAYFNYLSALNIATWADLWYVKKQNRIIRAARGATEVGKKREIVNSIDKQKYAIEISETSERSWNVSKNSIDL